jgi:signal transduction histidine kinase
MVIRRPNSITMTMVCMVLVGMAIGFGVHQLTDARTLLLDFSGQQEIQIENAKFFEQLPGRVATLVDLLDATPNSERSAIIAASQLPRIGVNLLTSGPGGSAGEDEPDADLLRRRIEAVLTVPRTIIVADWYWSPNQKTGVGPDRQKVGVVIQAALSDGRWVALWSKLGTPPTVNPVTNSFTQTAILMWLGLSCPLAVLFSVQAARRLTAPLSEVERAMDLLGSGGDDPPVPSHGPREIEAIIRAFNRMRERLRRFNDDRTRMMAAMSHDLRTPLTRLRMRIEMAQGLEDQQKMLNELDMMNGMVESILSFTREDARQEPRSLVDLSALVEGICEDAADAAETVTFAGPRDVVMNCRPMAMRRAISNLVDNAVKYGGNAEVTLVPEIGRAVISVEDEGPGIPRTEREKVFEPFYRIGSARDPGTGGVGLGLSVARSIVWEHGGDITLGNRKGGGLSVRVELRTGSPTPREEASRESSIT